MATLRDQVLSGTFNSATPSDWLSFHGVKDFALDMRAVGLVCSINYECSFDAGVTPQVIETFTEADGNWVDRVSTLGPDVLYRLNPTVLSGGTVPYRIG